jgi:uncharacterized protein
MPTIDQARAWYPADDPVHGFDHILRVHSLATKLANIEAADLEIVSAAVLLHDASGGQANDEGRGQHQNLSADFAQEILAAEGWPAERIAAVQHCIRSHRFRGTEQPNSLEAKIVFDADKLDVIGAFGIARTIGYAVEKGQPIFAQPSQQFLDSGEKQAGEPHSAFHEFVFKLAKIKDRLHTPSAREIAKERQTFLVNFFERLQAEANGQQ